jgi:hypothetical protein
MSEYQYYEFQAIDRPLTSEEMAQLRRLTTRATITPSRLQNVYHWGDFKGDPLELMGRYFDAFVYVANWGTHQFMLRLPRRAFDPGLVQRYCSGECLEVHAKGDNVILEFMSRDEEGTYWVEDEEAEAWMPALLPLRGDLIDGDLRGLYLAWLACVGIGELEDEEVEPPVPPGLGNLSAPLEAFAEFLRVDKDLLAVAAAGSEPLQEVGSSLAGLERWISELPDSEKDQLLVRAVKGEATQLRAELLARFREARAPAVAPPAGRRTVAELLEAAEHRAEARRREEAARKAAEQARQEREQALARARHLDALEGREEELWHQAQALIETKRPKEYDQAVELLKDLRDLSARRSGGDLFATRISRLRERYAKRPSLIERLDRAGLRA